MAELVNGRTPNGDSVLLRSVGWGTAAALALGAFAFTAQSEGGNARLQLALAGALADKPQAVAAIVPASSTVDPTLKALQERLARVDSERAGIDARLTTVEQGLQDVTGSVRRQAEAQATASAPKLTFLEPPVIPAINTLPAAPTPVSAPPPQVPAPEAHPPARPTHEAAAAPEPARIETPAPRAQAPHPSVPAQYGIELAAASDMQSLQARWLEIKANHGPLLAGLSPVAVKDHHKESHQLHLVAGPLMSMVAAQALCTKVAAEKGSCLARKVEAAEVVQR
jgi:hypothetical protein